jgi:uncharacterized RDD family membrane protein YckC
MRCPKCHYISFDSNDRCRNCGYEFSLAADVQLQALDLPIQTGQEAIGPLSDFTLTDLDKHPAVTPSPPARAARPEPEAPGRLRTAVPQPRPIAGSFDLPLFKDRRIDEDAPLVTPPAVPRAPLAVRRSSPLVTRAGGRAAVDEPVLDLESVESFEPVARFAPQAASDPHADTEEPSEPSASAAAGPRLLAAFVDALILGMVAAIVLYFTLKVCRLQFSELALLPPIPFAAFLSLLAGGYFILFTVAGGQTIGKMAAGIKVVAMDGDGAWSDRVPLGRAVLRAAGYLVSVLPAGLGFLPALVGADRRAVHDRLADTRVVKA